MEAELLSSGRKVLSTRIIPREILQGNQLGAAHPAGFLSLKERKPCTAHSDRHFLGLEEQQCSRTATSLLFTTAVLRKPGLLAPARPNLLLPLLFTFLPSMSNLSSAFPGCFLSQISSLASSSSLTLGFSIQTLFPCLNTLFSPQSKWKIGQGYFDFGHESPHSPHGFYCLSQLSCLHPSAWFILLTLHCFLSNLGIFKWHRSKKPKQANSMTLAGHILPHTPLLTRWQLNYLE